jgi:hypothetical protein
MLALGRQMEMDDLVTHALRFWPTPANWIRSTRRQLTRRYHDADPAAPLP